MMGRFDTRSFSDFWALKCGYDVPGYHSVYMDAGNAYEIPVIREVERVTGRRIRPGRRALYTPRLRLRVNYDGLTRDRLIEIKTAKRAFSRVPRGYWMQCQVLMYRTGRRVCELWLYVMKPEDYSMLWFPGIDPERLRRYEIEYDRDWIESRYLPRLRYLAHCLRWGTWPKGETAV